MAKSGSSTAGVSDLRWLIKFAAVDLEALSGAELSSWRDQAQAFAGRYTRAGVLSMPLTNESWAWMARSPSITGVSPERVRAALVVVQTRLLDGLAALRTLGKAWELPATQTSLVAGPKGLKRVVREPTGTPEGTFIAAAAEVLYTHWGLVRTCAYSACSKTFVGRVKYCTPLHGQEARWAKFAAKRERDYAAEYLRRLRKRTGPKVKAGKRRRS